LGLPMSVRAKCPKGLSRCSTARVSMGGRSRR
jgi:hypothetical protein